MKNILLALCGLLAIGVNASPFGLQLKDECANGPVTWCENFGTAKSCNAVKHCIQTVWETHKYPVDNDSICKICLDMVQQARDQLRSNETQDDLKAVFEGSCELIRIKAIRKECDKLADDFVPELIEALSSQMNPQVVCSVAGLCNNAAIDVMLRDAAENGLTIVSEPTKPVSKGLTCAQCGQVSKLITDKFAGQNRDEVLENMLMMCRPLGTFTDACAAIVLTYFNDIYGHMKENLTPDNICHMSGTCAYKYHQHEETMEVEVIPDSEIGFTKPMNGAGSDDIPCDLCKQLVTHLRDVLVANTTETEFKMVLEGFCKQTKSFKSECLDIVDKYYTTIYLELTKELNPNDACFMIGICPKGLAASKSSMPMQMMPLVPVKLIEKQKAFGADESFLSVQEIKSFQLPKDVLLLDANQMKQQTVKTTKDGQLCTLCQYFLNFVQEALASPKNAESIKKTVETTCEKLPKAFTGECQAFVDTYGDAIIAMIVQDIDPSLICPKIGVCMRETPLNNEKCPLCLFLIQELEETLKGDRSKANIKSKLTGLCSHLSNQLRDECSDFVQTYTDELIDKLADEFSPQEICLSFKLCTAKEEILIQHLGDKKSSADLLSNSVYQVESEEDSSEESSETQNPECMLCEQLVKDVEKRAINDKSKEHIKASLEEACEKFHNEKLKEKCISVVDKNSDFIVEAIIKNLAPKEICTVLGFCFGEAAKPVFHPIEKLSPVLEEKIEETPQCVFCQMVMVRLEAELRDKKTQDEIRQSVQNICSKLPKKYSGQCKQFVQQYAEIIISLIDTVPPKKLCGEINLCLTNQTKDLAKDEVTACAVCRAATESLAKYMKKNEIRDRDYVVEKTCNELPARYYSRCEKFMTIYIESLEHLIERSEKLSVICDKVGMCFANGDDSLFVQITQDQVSHGLVDSSESNESDESDESDEPRVVPKKTKHLLGAGKCSFGPSYWCSSLEATRECNAHTYCSKHVMQVSVILP